ncbi:DUF695 domain-containing protein [Microcoleus sp. Pol7_A1]|uniref:DUF695 domain-containing protein n=1 Tax=Microcoleus sp. Pol7_A1 TaxID=2818893 RepID=UPI002FD68EB2
MTRHALTIFLSILMTTQAFAQEWATAVSRHHTEDRAIVFRYVKTFTPQFNRSSQPDRIILVWNYKSDSGMPSVKERQMMDKLEDSLSPTIEGDGFATLALVSTGENSREWIYYARSEDEFMVRLNAALKDSPEYPIEIHAAPDPAWETYEEFFSGLSGGHG